MDNKKTILLVDDDESMRGALKQLLEAIGGYNVIVASSKEEGLASYHAERKNIDLVVTDCDMPKRDQGLELISDIRSHGGNIPIVMISARPEVADKLNLKPGNNAFLLKPFKAAELLGKVDEMLTGPEQRRG